MRRRHLSAVSAIERLAYPRPWPESLFAAELRRTDRCYLVAQRRTGGRHTVVGYAGSIVGAGEAHVTTVAVDPSWRGRQVGARLLVETLAAAVRLGAFAATLEVRVSNHRAQRLYRTFGFVPAGLRPRYYADNGEDARIMWLHDLSTPEVAERVATAATRRGLPVPAVFRG